VLVEIADRMVESIGHPKATPDELLVSMKGNRAAPPTICMMKRSIKEVIHCAARLPLLGVVLAVCFLSGQGIRASNFAGQSIPTSSAGLFTGSFPTDDGILSHPKQSQIQIKAPRRQPSVGALPPTVISSLAADGGERTSSRAPRALQTTVTRPNDRAPPPTA